MLLTTISVTSCSVESTYRLMVAPRALGGWLPAVESPSSGRARRGVAGGNQENPGKDEVVGGTEGRVPPRDLRRHQVRSMCQVPEGVQNQANGDESGSPPETKKRKDDECRARQTFQHH